MPNWCVNQVEIFGEPAVVAELVKFVREESSEDTDAQVFSFRKIVAPPDTALYKAEASSAKYACGCEQQFVDGKRLVGGVEVGPFDKCPHHNAVSMIDCEDNWWHWNINNWGTKWSANNVYLSDSYDEGVDEMAQYEFETAWSPCEPIILALSEKFPTLTLTHRYCEGGIGFAGQVVYRGGNEIAREDYEYGDALPDEAWSDEDRYERDYDTIPMTAMERFCDEHFGGIVGG